MWEVEGIRRGQGGGQEVKTRRGSVEVEGIGGSKTRDVGSRRTKDRTRRRSGGQDKKR